MKFGLIARAEDRGLGIQTWEIARNLRPDRVLIVDMDGLNAGYSQHFDRYLDLGLSVTIVHHSEMGNPDVVGPWCSGLDVIYTAETFYRWAFCDIARANGARTVCHLNPEFFKHCADDWNEPLPDVWWAPSPWLRDHPKMPETTFVPMPVPTDRWPDPAPEIDGVVTFVHPSGHPASLDRNGTRLLFASLRLVTQKMNVVMVSQVGSFPRPGRTASGVKYRSVIGGVRNYWDVPTLGDVVVIPRKYGGLCLPALEAAGAGRALVMTDCSPNTYYPAVLAECTTADTTLAVGVGELPLHDVSPRALAHAMDLLADPAVCAVQQQRAREWADEHSWARLRDEWVGQLTAVAAT